MVRAPISVPRPAARFCRLALRLANSRARLAARIRFRARRGIPSAPRAVFLSRGAPSGSRRTPGDARTGRLPPGVPAFRPPFFRIIPAAPDERFAPVRVITWNLNSIRTRRNRLFRLLERHRPDVLCLQELRAEAEVFPAAEAREAGYRAIVHAQAARNGVAILAKEPLAERRRGLPQCAARGEARLLDVSVAGVRVISAYVPNGKAVSHPDWDYKLAWLAGLREHLDREARAGEALILCGDFNVAPSSRDTSSPDPGGVLCHPSARAALAGSAPGASGTPIGWFSPKGRNRRRGSTPGGTTPECRSRGTTGRGLTTST